MKFALWTHRWKLALIALLLGAFAADAMAQTVPRPPRRGTKYKVRIDSAPPGAQVFLDDEKYGPVGTTPWNGRLQRGDWVVILKKDGYETARRNINVRRRRSVQDTFIPLVKKDDPAKIDVRADADKNAFNAQVWVDGQLQGQIPLLLKVEDGRHLVEIKKEGFQTFSQWIEAKEGVKVAINPVLKAVVVEKKGSILVEADVPNAEVYLDGNLHPDKTPTMIADIAEGPHIIEVKKDPAIPWKQTIQVVADKSVKVSAQLKATIKGPVATIRVLSNVEGARVLLDGKDLGPVPLDIKDVEPGDHLVEVKAPGYLPGERRVTVNAGSAPVLKFDLQPEASKETGIIKVVSPVPEAQVFIDGARIGTVPQEKELKSGEHFVVVTKTGFTKFEQKVRLEAGQAMTVTAQLEAVGGLRVLSTPSGADVLLDGKEIGKTPFNKEDIEVGEHLVTVRYPDHEPYEEQIKIEGGQKTIVNGTLVAIDTGPTPDELLAERRSLSSFGARVMARRRSTIDLGAGYPYFLEGQVTIGAGSVGGVPFDAGVLFRSFFSRTELGFKTRFQLADSEPFAFALWTQIGGGSNFLDDSGRNNFFMDVGLLGSLTGLSILTVTGRAYLNIWSDRHCPAMDDTQSVPLSVCESPSPEDQAKLDILFGDTGNPGSGMAPTEREAGVRLMLSALVELAVHERWNVWVLFEGAPFQSERPGYVDLFSPLLFKDDIGTYFRLGTTYKFFSF